MRLPSANLSLDQKLDEFDQWLTPKLDRIKNSDKFNDEIKWICSCIEHLAPYLNNFRSPNDCNTESLTKAVIKSSQSFVLGSDFQHDENQVSNYYDAIFNLLFLSTGATDNNLKNHFLIKLKEDGVSFKVPKRNNGKKQIVFELNELPSTTKSDFISKLLASYLVGSTEYYFHIVKTIPVFSLFHYLEIYMQEYMSLILEDEEGLLQLWAICNSYMSLCEISTDYGRYLINSCTIFKVRGSVSASGGHITENILRGKLEDIGLQKNLDFNENDVTIGEEIVVEEGKRKRKTRAYDFILPYKTKGWEPKIFIQSQFYAGDSGSVSHKVVDQTSSSRQFTKQKYPHARFVEYLDGAGYYASLRGDLKHMLSMEDTHSFFQVKSILIRLRRELQEINFLTPIELEHAILATNNANRNSVFEYLIKDGYSIEEIKRVEAFSIEKSFIRIDGESYVISDERQSYARKIFILDIAAKNADHIYNLEIKQRNYILLPGFGPNYGILGSKLAELVCLEAKSINISIVEYEQDIEWLLNEKVISFR